ncbi:MAG: TRAM domain-containing protein [Candidatus Saccharimonas sp.]
MNTNLYQTILMVVNALVLIGVLYLVTRLPRTTMKTRQRGILVDTSVLMDGRITAVAATSFMGGALVIPRSVVGELQLLADGSDSDRRARARRGLDIVNELQHTAGIEVEILQDGARADEGVDNRLLTLAKRHGAAICTLDYNLNKVAVVEGITVLNINELAQSLRMSHLPGEHINVEVTQKGQDSHQAVGHLADGTMVVVEQASSRIGQTVEVEIIRSLQTAAGRMMFARLLDKEKREQPKQAYKRAEVTATPRAKQQRTAPRKDTRTRQDAPAPAVAHIERNQSSSHSNTSSNSNHNASRGNSRRPPTSRQREAAFINLVDKQS